MSLRDRIEQFRRGFSDIFDAHGKFKKDYVENLEAIAVKNIVDCDNCKHKYDGLYTMVCYSCKHYHPSMYEEA